MSVACPQCDHPAAPDAVSAGVCARCGASLAAMAEIDISKLEPLDARRGPPRAGDAAGPPASAFAPPGELPEDDQVLGVERSTRAIRIESGWQRERVEKRAAAALPPPRPPRRIGGVIAALAASAVVAFAVLFIVRYQRAPRPARPGGGISIRIIAREPTAVAIDGHAMGKTPLTLQRAKASQPIVITGPQVTRQVIPDHDQVVDLSP